MSNAHDYVAVEETVVAVVEVTGAPVAARAEPAEYQVPTRRMAIAAAIGAAAGLVFSTLHTGPAAGLVWLVEAMLVMAGFAIVATLAATVTAPQPTAPGC